MAVTPWTATGTHTGEWRGMPATNLPYVDTGMTMSKFSDGSYWLKRHTRANTTSCRLNCSERPASGETRG